MAPVISLDEASWHILGLNAGDVILGGEHLSFRRELDPIATLLDNGLPRAVGYRPALPADVEASRLQQAVIHGIANGGAVTYIPEPTTLLTLGTVLVPAVLRHRRGLRMLPRPEERSLPHSDCTGSAT